jgi:nickel/cobalt exporter
VRRPPGGTVQRRLSRRLLALAVGLVGAAAASLALAAPAAAHPLGNFTVNQYSGLRVQPTAVLVDYVLDLAEIPTFQTRSQLDTDGDGTVAPSERDSWRASTCARIAGQLRLTADGVPAPLAVDAATLSFPPGAAGLETLRLGCSLRAAVRVDRARQLSYRVTGYPDRIGWREVTAVGDGTTLTGSTVPVTSRSNRLTGYPADLLSAPLDVRGADLQARPGGARMAPVAAPAGPAAPLARGVDRATSAFTNLVARRHLTVAFGLVAVLLSVLLGALHAFAPGHGKTVMAAFLVGGRGTLRQALTIGLTVTATHTAGVLVLGTVLTTSVALAPQTVYPWLGIASGLVLAGVGVTLVRRVRAGADLDHAHPHAPAPAHSHGPAHAPAHPHGHARSRDHGPGHADPHDHGPGHEHPPDHGPGHADPHDHGPGHEHPHPHDHAHPHRPEDAHPDRHRHDHPDGDTHPHRHGPGHPSAAPGSARPVVRRRGLLAMGFAGGLVPSPSALVVLLGAIALGRTWFGILLVVGYGLGMAAALMGIGLLLARGRRLLERRPLPPRVRSVAARLPLATAALVVIVGAGLAAQAVLTLTSG